MLPNRTLHAYLKANASFTQTRSSQSPMKNTSKAERVLATSVSSPARLKRSLKREGLTESTSSNGDRDDHTNSTTLNSSHSKTSDSKTNCDAGNFVKSENCTCSSNEQFSKEREKNDSRISESILDEIPAADGPLNENPRSGWISKKKSCDEKFDIRQSSKSNTAVDSNGEIEKSNEVSENSGRDMQKGHSEKLIALPGFISKQERRKVRFWIITLHYIATLHHSTPPHTTLHYPTPHYTTLPLHHTTPHHTTLHYTTPPPHYTTLHHTTPHYPTQHHHTTLHHITLHYTTQQHHHTIHYTSCTTLTTLHHTKPHNFTTSHHTTSPHHTTQLHHITAPHYNRLRYTSFHYKKCL